MIQLNLINVKRLGEILEITVPYRVVRRVSYLLEELQKEARFNVQTMINASLHKFQFSFLLFNS